MKNKHARGILCHMPAAICRLLFLCIFSCSLISPAFAQYDNSQIYVCTDHTNYWDVKGFSSIMVPGSTNSNMETVMAGTVYDANGEFGTPVFIHTIDNNPTIDWPKIKPTSGSSFHYYPDANFYQQRTIGVVAGNPADANQIYYIIVAVREDNLTVTGARDKIKIIAVDVDGALQSVFPGGNTSMTIDDPNTANGGYCIYPLHATTKFGVYDGSTSNNDLLYICGYVNQTNTTDNTSGQYVLTPGGSPPGWPGFNTPKAAFVLSVDIFNGGNFGGCSGAVMNYRNYDYVPTIIGSWNPFDINDYDMAVRMTPMSSNYNTQIDPNHGVSGEYIHVTGSVNSITGSSNAAPPQYNTVNRSATMNMVIDAWDLSIRMEGHFIAHDINPDGIGTSEYGVGFKERTFQDPWTSGLWHSDNYVVGNIYQGMPGSYTTYITAPNNAIDYTYLFNMIADTMYVAYTDGNMQATQYTPSTKQQRMKFMESWAVQVLESSYSNGGGGSGYFGTNPISGSGEAFTIAGMTRKELDPWNIYSMTLPASDNNILPFLYEFDAQYHYTSMQTTIPGGTLLNVLREYGNLGGTGDASNLHDYRHNGNDLASIWFGPTYATRIDPSSEIAFNAPRYYTDPTGGTSPLPSLGLKTYFALGDIQAGGYHNTCNGWMNPSALPQYIQPYDDGQVGIFFSTHDYPATPHHDQVSDTHYGYYDINYGDCKTSVYKTTNVAQVPRAVKTSIHPNPAKYEINLTLAKNIADDANLKVQLVNMQGQLVATLYNGTVKNAIEKMQLPEVANGLYMVQVYSNGTMVHHEKLSIQQ